ncbi:MAG: hypothetical protein HWD61_00970 [Parachlamydiaceae bacterium]|nr:MAG: hypothetical protein HWD61_00970 [Parachlamydiaceae bacterium]
MAAVFLHMVALSTMMQQNTGAFVPGAETKNNSTQLPEALNNLLIELQRIASLSTEKFKSLTLDPENLTQEIICQEEANLKKQLDQIKCHFEEDIKVILTSKAIQSEKSEQFESSLSKLKAEFYAAYEAKLQELSNSAKSLIAILNQTLSSDTETNEPQAEPNLKAAETKKFLRRPKTPRLKQQKIPLMLH